MSQRTRPEGRGCACAAAPRPERLKRPPTLRAAFRLRPSLELGLRCSSPGRVDDSTTAAEAPLLEGGGERFLIFCMPKVNVFLGWRWDLRAPLEEWQHVSGAHHQHAFLAQMLDRFTDNRQHFRLPAAACYPLARTHMGLRSQPVLDGCFFVPSSHLSHVFSSMISYFLKSTL